ncbi:MAG: hypothetical protein H6622_14035 [Halobacteriovoraceae bacterium]|nr:hypothetical protein [Halobacteriovoraceae bacterium]
MKIIYVISLIALISPILALEHFPIGSVLKNKNKYLYIACEHVEIKDCSQMRAILKIGKKETIISEFKGDWLINEGNPRQIDNEILERLKFNHIRTAIIGTRASVFITGLALDKLGIFPIIEDKKGIRQTITIVGAIPGVIFDIVKLPVQAIVFIGEYIFSLNKGKQYLLALFNLSKTKIYKVDVGDFEIMLSIFSGIK